MFARLRRQFLKRANQSCFTPNARILRFSKIRGSEVKHVYARGGKQISRMALVGRQGWLLVLWHRIKSEVYFERRNDSNQLGVSQISFRPSVRFGNKRRRGLNWRIDGSK